ncbi:Hypothetical protein CAP_8707 [Chondromyces apiculatus DSM 436]|uniref:Uncharacterized protein n=1 Tax=Chondromyces apiculatus DSM 436 TaxID=1192034 RepID=A0A017TED8_9BACT|nr:Hypothetical protein CAP_8707 [Chondromyces apiculatus DSM 436]
MAIQKSVLMAAIYPPSGEQTPHLARGPRERVGASLLRTSDG